MAPRRAIRLCLLLLVASAAWPAAPTLPLSFDHQTTGFELDGAHRDLPCESCHINAIFKGTPQSCDACHSRGTRYNAMPKPANHVLTSDRCDACHNTTAYKPVVHFDHAEVRGSCASCHNNTQAQGKPAIHISTTADCATCHSTAGWLPAAFDHAGIADNCFGCHNGTRASGKNATHLATSNSCESCHSVNAWQPWTRFDHSQASGSCESCHSGLVATSVRPITGKSVNHIASDAGCANCHVTVAWAPANFAHAGITGSCESCHNGTQAEGKNSAHLASSNNCESCHSVVVWKPSVRVDHTQVSGSCLSCHNNSLAISTGTVAGKSPAHITSDNNCQGCHSVTVWKPGSRVDHTLVSGTCVSCHNNSLVISSGTVAGKTPTHIISDNNCQNCHSTLVWKPANFTHAGITSSCVSCHNGTQATGKNLAHMASSNSCASCHSVTVWKPGSRVDHTQVSGTCLSCHNNTLAISTGTVAGKTPLHITSDNSCQNCHTTLVWKPANFQHNGIAGNCFGCHNGTQARGKSAAHMASSTRCESCHSVTVWQPSISVDHTQVSGTCLSCHNNSQVISSGTVAGKTATHIPTDNNCQSCHTTLAWKPANFQHNGVTGNCVSCHNGTQATGKNLTHIASTNGCESCHSVITWKPSFRVDHTQVSGTCLSCHNNTLVISTGTVAGKTAAHIPADNSCENCHTTLVWQPANFRHNGVTGNCFSCHNGTQAAGKNLAHIASSNSCESCHSVAVWKPGIRVDHAQVSGSCVSCHNNTLAISTGTVAGKATLHIPADNTCQSCHTTLAWIPATFSHTGITTSCASCHNGTQATGKSPTHIASATRCESCHSTTAWQPSVSVDHTQVSGTCLSCHNNSLVISTGTVAGKTTTHIPVDNNCQSCHTTLAWKPANFQHNGVTGNCVSCHNGTQASGKNLTHIASSNGCESCHSVIAWKPSVTVDHTQVSGTCLSCHNNSLVISTGTVAGKTPTHITADNSCQNCHTTLAWKPANFQHNGITGNCFSCHNGTQAVGKNPTHIATTNSCESCHNVAVWKPGIRVDHAQVSGSCLSCHNNTLAISSGTVAGKTATHIPADNNCQNCHTTLGWIPATFSHIGIATNCFSCHNGAQATGKSATHIASATRCESCHSTTTWQPSVRVDHTQVSGTCLSCHNNSLTISTGTVAGKSLTHIPVDNNCQSCHTTLAWKPANFQHNGVTGNCFSCHNGTQATGKTQTHMASSNSCESCHSVTVWKPSIKVDHAQVSGACLSCHNNTLVISTGTVAGKIPTHIPADNNCQNCHTTLAWKPANFQHNGITGNCFSCHNGIQAAGKNTLHLATSNSCESCHSVIAWKPAASVNHAEVNGTCLSCHNNGLVISTGPVAGKTLTHIAADNNCQNCHTTLAWKPANFKHNGITGNCVSCHNGGPATGKTPTHIASTNSCESCHSVAAWKPAIKVDHAQVSGACLSCHNNTLVISTGTVVGKIPTHIPADNNCQSCHTTLAWKPANFQHNGITGNCVSCHNGTQATGKTLTHIASSNSCESCHSVAAWKPGLKVDHTQVSGTCLSCHSNTLLISTGTVAGKPPTHIPSDSNCQTCHTTQAWRPASFSHAGITNNCFSCHNLTMATGKSAVHITTSNSCESCHLTTQWTPAQQVDHVQVTGTCVSCHSGTKSISTGLISGMSATHMPTSNSCTSCHKTTAWKPAVADHKQIPLAQTGKCITCHNGAIASGKNVNHVVTTKECGVCHTTLAWKPATFSHTGITTGCGACHDGIHAAGKQDASKPHFVTTRDCNFCHTTTAWTPSTKYVHVSLNYPGDHKVSITCTNSGCHGTNAETVTWRSPTYANSCAGCHQSNYKSDPHNKYGNVRYTVGELKNCSGACHVYASPPKGVSFPAGTTPTTAITTRRNGPQHRVTHTSWAN